MKSFLADLLSVLFLKVKHLVQKLFFDFLNLEAFQMEFSCAISPSPFAELTWLLGNLSIIGTTVEVNIMKVNVNIMKAVIIKQLKNE